MSDSGEGRWTVHAAIDEGVPADVLSAALFDRFASRGEADFADKLLSAMRKEFGGHDEKLDQTIGSRSSWRPAPDNRVRRASCSSGAPATSRYKKMFPALYAMVKQRAPDVPIIGVASSHWTLDDLSDRAARQHREVRRRRRRRREAFDHLIGSLRYVDGDYRDAATFTELQAASSSDARLPGALPRDPAEHVRDGDRGARDVGLRRRTRG